MSNAMAYACSTCGKVMASEGGMAVHLAGHVAQSDADAARAAAAARAMEAAAAPPETVSGARPSETRPVLVLGAVVVFLLVAGLIGAANPHLIKKKHRQTVAAGSGPTSVAIPTAPTTVVPPGFRVADNGHGFSVAVPDRFHDVDPLKQDPEATIAAARQANPKLAQALTNLHWDRNTMKFLSIDVSTGNNVLVQDLGPVDAPVSEFPTGQLDAVFKKAGASSVSHQFTHIAAGDALRYDVTIPFGTLTDHAIAFITVANGHGYTLTLTTFQNLTPQELDTIVQSFKVTA